MELTAQVCGSGASLPSTLLSIWGPTRDGTRSYGPPKTVDRPTTGKIRSGVVVGC